MMKMMLLHLLIMLLLLVGVVLVERRRLVDYRSTMRSGRQPNGGNGRNRFRNDGGTLRRLTDRGKNAAAGNEGGGVDAVAIFVVVDVRRDGIRFGRNLWPWRNRWSRLFRKHGVQSPNGCCISIDVDDNDTDTESLNTICEIPINANDSSAIVCMEITL